MASSDEYRRWISEARNEQRILRDHGCHREAENMQRGIDAYYASMADAMDREEYEDYERRLDEYDHTDHG